MLRKKPLVCREVAVCVLLSAACVRRGTQLCPHQSTSRLTMVDNFENPVQYTSHKQPQRRSLGREGLQERDGEGSLTAPSTTSIPCVEHQQKASIVLSNPAGRLTCGWISLHEPHQLDGKSPIDVVPAYAAALKGRRMDPGRALRAVGGASIL